MSHTMSRDDSVHALPSPAEPGHESRSTRPADLQDLGMLHEDAAPPATLTETNITTLIHQLHAGEVTVSDLTAETRQQCVAQLTLDGFTVSEIAQLMRVSERTVKRDRSAVRHDEALPPARSLGDELLGELQRLTYASVQRLTRLAREPDAPAYARLWAEEALTRVYRNFIQTVHRLDYLETGRARLTHARETDPAEQQRARDRIDAIRKMVL